MSDSTELAEVSAERFATAQSGSYEDRAVTNRSAETSASSVESLTSKPHGMGYTGNVRLKARTYEDPKCLTSWQ